jgi:hypothetical protein
MFLHRDHLEEAHAVWKTVVRPGDLVIDAKLGKGRDAAVLASLCLREDQGQLWGLDLQRVACEMAWETLRTQVPEPLHGRIHIRCMSHASFPSDIQPNSVRLITYNLGYLPGSDGSIITLQESTLASLQQATLLIQEGGLISCTCYPGHSGGAEEEAAVLRWASTLPRSQWTVQHIRWLNRRAGPSLLLVERLMTPVGRS